MKDFFKLISVAEAVGRLTQASPMPPCELPLDEAAGHVLAEDVFAPEDLPLLSRSSMDGYAVRAQDTFGASEGSPAYLELAATLEIDDVPDFTLPPGHAAALVTGSALPDGADAVVMVEHTEAMGGDTLEIRKAVAPGGNVMLRGEDCRAGDVLLSRGTVLRPQEIGLLAALGVLHVQAHRRPASAIFSTGDEVVPVTAAARPGQVRDVNSAALAAMLRQAGFHADALGIAQDDERSLHDFLQRGMREHDVLFLSGGSSMGVRDLSLAAISRLPNAEILAHGLALSPGKPLILARAEGPRGICHIFGLPGQVTSAQVVAFVLGIPFLRHLAGERAPSPFDQRFWPARRVTLDRNIPSAPGREDYVRLARTGEAAAPSPDTAPLPLARPLFGKSGLLRTLVQADGLVRIPAESEGLTAGTAVDMLLL